MMGQFPTALSMLAVVLHVSAFIMYARQAKKKKTDFQPNPASWMVWVLLATLNAFTYRRMSGDVVKSLLSIAGSLGCIYTFISVLFRGKFRKLTAMEWTVFSICLAGIAAYKAFESATYANLIVMGAFVISCWPLLRDVIENPHCETSRPWIVWTGAFMLGAIVVALRYKQPQDFAYPVICIAFHGAIAYLARPGRQLQFGK